MIWAEVKHSLNSSVGTNDHKPLDQEIKRNAYEAFYDVADYYNSITNNEGVVIVPREKYEITNGDFDTGDGTRIVVLPWGLKTIRSNAFYNCKQLRKIFMPNTVKNIEDGAFTGCIALTSISIPNSVDVISEKAFVRMTNLANIYIDKKESDVPAGAPWGATSATIHYRT